MVDFLNYGTTRVRYFDTTFEHIGIPRVDLLELVDLHVMMCRHGVTWTCRSQ